MEQLTPLPKTGLEKFASSAIALGAKDMHIEQAIDGTITIKQKLGEGWQGLGFDGQNLWMGLTPANLATKHDWNGNTLLIANQKYTGITTGEHGQLAQEHPIATLTNHLLQIDPTISVHITGDHTKWQINENTKLTSDKQGNLIGNIPIDTELKAVICGATDKISINWIDGDWKSGQNQQLSFKTK